MNFPAYNTLSIQIENGGIAIAEFNRPQTANALNSTMAKELADFFRRLPKFDAIRAVILAGKGKHFCAGADLKERKGMDKRAWDTQHHTFEQALRGVLHCKIPVIAAVHGAAMAGGLELALAADFIYAAENARFALTEVTLGIMPGLGGTQQLPRAVGMRRAKECLFTGSIFSAQDAYQWGMVNKVCAPDALLAEAINTAHHIAVNAPLSVKAIKQSVNKGAAKTLPQALERELEYYHTLLNTKDRHEGINAFNEKRKPVFTGS